MRLLLRKRGPRAGAEDESAQACDVVYTGEESDCAPEMVEAQLRRTESASLRQLIAGGWRRMESVYAAGEFIAHPARLLAMVRRTSVEFGIVAAGDHGAGVLQFFDRLNRVLFTQQTLAWLIDSGLSVRVHGTGWDRHPRLRVFADETDAGPPTTPPQNAGGRIHLAMGPYGAVSPRVLDDVASGAFHLFRFCPADVIERLYPPIQEFCLNQGITNNQELSRRALPAIRRLLAFADRTLGIDVLLDWPQFVPHVLACASSGRVRSAAALFTSYPTVVFSTRDELRALCRKYVDDVRARTRIGESMRRELADRRVRVELTLPTSATPLAEAA